MKDGRDCVQRGRGEKTACMRSARHVGLFVCLAYLFAANLSVKREPEFFSQSAVACVCVTARGRGHQGGGGTV